LGLRARHPPRTPDARTSARLQHRR
jgi:hypothetical protein